MEASGSYDAAGKKFTLTLKQSTPATPGQSSKQPVHIPVTTGLLLRDSGEEVVPSQVRTYVCVSEAAVQQMSWLSCELN